MFGHLAVNKHTTVNCEKSPLNFDYYVKTQTAKSVGSIRGPGSAMVSTFEFGSKSCRFESDP